MEIILELIIEVFGELIITILAEVIGSLVKVIDGDEKLKRRLKFIFTYSILGLTILLITMSLIYSKTFLTTIAISYMLLSLLITLAKRLNEDRFDNRAFAITISVFKRVVSYSYPILLIVFSSIYLENVKVLVAIIILSVVAFILWFSIDMYKIWKYSQLKAERNCVKKLEEL